MEALIRTNLAKTNRQLIIGKISQSAISVLGRTDLDIVNAYADHTLINQYNDHYLKIGVVKLITNIGVLYGISQEPEDEHLILTVKFIKDYHGGHTLEEIYKAASMNLAGEFSKTDKDGQLIRMIETYGSVSTKFLAELMVSYELHRVVAHKRLNSFVQDQKVEAYENTKPGYRNGDMYNRIIEWINGNGLFPMFWNWRAVFKHIEAEGMFFDTAEQREGFRKRIEGPERGSLKRQQLLSEDVIQHVELGKMVDGNYATNGFYEAYVKEWLIASGLIDKNVQPMVFKADKVKRVSMDAIDKTSLYVVK